MIDLLAYIIVLVLGQFCITGGVLIGGMLSLLLFWLPDRVRVPFCALAGGLAGPLLAVAMAYLVFNWLVGPESFGVFPFLCALVSVSIPIYNDYRLLTKLQSIQNEAPVRVADYVSGDIMTRRTILCGELAGVVVAAILFL